MPCSVPKTVVVMVFFAPSFRVWMIRHEVMGPVVVVVLIVMPVPVMIPMSMVPSVVPVLPVTTAVTMVPVPVVMLMTSRTATTPCST